MEQAPSPDTNFENIEKIKRLRNYLNDGFLLHGGKKRIETLEPRQATDDNPDRKTGKAFAIYAEKYDIRIPILKALFDKKDPTKKSSSSGYSAHGPHSQMTVRGQNCTFTKGYVYVLPSDSFTIEGNESDNEYISHDAIHPIDIIEVDPSILVELEGINIEIAD